jgi:CRP-like cAMP-binding protein
MTGASGRFRPPGLPAERHVPRGKVIFRQGEEGREMFVIGAGRVRLTIGTDDGHEREIAVFGQGDFFGELSLLGDAPRTATATAMEDSTLLVLSRDVFAMMVQDDLEIVFRMMNAQGQRLSNTNVPIQQLMQQLGRIRVASHCLRRLLGGAAGGFDVEALAAELALPPQAVSASIAHFASQGAGTVQGQHWSIAGQEQVQRLVEAICSNATIAPPS